MSELIPVDRTIPPSFDYDAFSLPENVSLTFHLNPHKSSGDLPEPAELMSIIKSADIVIPEYIHDEKTKNSMSRISAGSKKEYDAFRPRLQGNDAGDWMRAIISALYATRTATTNIDIPFNHPATHAFLRTEDKLHRGTVTEVRSHFDEVLGGLTANFAAIKARDQQILENIVPEIEDTVSNNRRLATKRENEALGVRIFYGTAHRSLLDAALTLQALNPVEGFSAQPSPDILEGDLMPIAYGKYLRGQDIAVEDVERIFAYTAFGAVVHNRKYLGPNPAGRVLVNTFLELEDQLDTTDFRHLVEQVKDIFES